MKPLQIGVRYQNCKVFCDFKLKSKEPRAIKIKILRNIRDILSKKEDLEKKKPENKKGIVFWERFFERSPSEFLKSKILK